jgi:O-antigen ligase
MTDLATPLVAIPLPRVPMVTPAPARAGLMAQVRRHAGPASAVVATAWWLVEVTRAWGGRNAPSVTVGAALIAVSLLLVRPERILPRLPLVLASVLSVVAFVIPLIAPSGWAGAPDAAPLVSGAWLTLVVAAVIVSRPDAKTWFLLVIAASAGIEFMSGWLAWWGGEDPTAPMIGTFYWHNPFAAFLAPGGLVALGFWVWRTRVLATLGLISFALATVGVVYSTSRATLACFVLGLVLVGAAAVVHKPRWRAIRRLTGAVVVAVGSTFLIAGPPFFPHRASPLAATQARAATESLGQNGFYRLDFWREALAVFWRHPLIGGGYKSLVAESVGHVPKGWPLSPYTHNAYLGVLAKGGLLLGVPYLLAMGLVAAVVVRTLWLGVVRRRIPAENVAIAAALACVMLHAGVDFDWSYAANFAMASTLAGLLIGLTLRDRPKPSPPKYGRMARAALVGCLVIGVGTLGVSAWVQRNGNHTANLSTDGAPR